MSGAQKHGVLAAVEFISILRYMHDIRLFEEYKIIFARSDVTLFRLRSHVNTHTHRRSSHAFLFLPSKLIKFYFPFLLYRSTLFLLRFVQLFFFLLFFIFA